MENRKRNVQIIIRVTEEERALIEEKMQQIPTLNLSAYARKMLIDGYIITLDLQEVKGHTAQLQKIGVNVNQIAKRINETGRIYADDMDEMKRVAEYLIRNETMDGETFVKVYNGEIVPDKIVGEDLMTELQQELHAKVSKPAESAEELAKVEEAEKDLDPDKQDQ